MKTVHLFILLTLFAAVTAAQVKKPEPPAVKVPFAESLQAVVVTTSDTAAIQGVGRLYERKSARSVWKAVGKGFPVVIGRNGLARERGSFQKDAPTLGPVFKRYCAAWETRDEARLKKSFSADTIKDITREMKDAGIKTLSEFLADDNTSTELCKVSDEEISNNVATAIVNTKSFPNGYRMMFLKEDGEWKISNLTPPLGGIKKEGDGRSPAGLFPLTFAFGRPEKPGGVKLSYTKLEKYTECVDDAASHHYNKLVDRLQVGIFDWKSSEKMLEVGPEYDLGLFVAHNSYPVRPGDGSCIFLHVWKDASTGTSGCTAMKREDLERLLAWADPAKTPYLVQMTKADLTKYQESWKLPKLN